MAVRSPTTAIPEPFSSSRFQTMVQFHSTFRSCLKCVPLNEREYQLHELRAYLELLLTSPWPAEIPKSAFPPQGWEAACAFITNSTTTRQRLQRHDELVCFVSEALCEAEDDMVNAVVSTLTDSPSLAPAADDEMMSSPSSPNSRRRFLRRRSKEGSDNTDAPEETETLVRDTVEDIYRQLLETDSLPTEGDICFLLENAMNMFAQEPNVVLVPTPAVLVGDVHGQIKDLKERILAHGGPLGTSTYLFLGDYVDRGDSSLHCIALLVAAKILFPDKVFLIRGNHESRNTNGCYGYLSECHHKFPRADSDDDDDDDEGGKATPKPPRNFEGGMMAFGLGPHPLWDMSNKLFDQMPIAAIVGEKIFCVHGGLSPRAHHLAQVVACRRDRDVSTGGILADLTWSDPCSGLEGFAPNHRGCGQLFGEDVTSDFLETSGLAFVCRAHQCVRTGYLWTHNEKVVTVFSAPNYCGQGNDGAIMLVDVHGSPSFTTFRSALSWDERELDDFEEGNEDGDTVASPTANHAVTPPPKTTPMHFQNLPPLDGASSLQTSAQAKDLSANEEET